MIGLASGAESLKLPPWLTIPMASLLLVAAAMIYFRLLGRVAWCYAQAVAKDEREVAESADEEEREE